MYLVCALIVIIIILIIYRVRKLAEPFTVSEAVNVSAFDGRSYKVQPGHENPREAADKLARINEKIMRLLAHLERKYATASPSRGRHEATRMLRMRYRPDRIVENSPNNPENDTSYVEDKGAVFAICLRDKRSPGGNKFHSDEVLTFVVLHELAHIGIPQIQHVTRFWQAFKWLLEEAVELGIIEQVDYRRVPEFYCSIDINYNPLYDHTLTAI